MPLFYTSWRRKSHFSRPRGDPCHHMYSLCAVTMWITLRQLSTIKMPTIPISSQVTICRFQFRLFSMEEVDIDVEDFARVKTHKTHYEDLCSNANIVPCSYFLAHIHDEELILRHHQFSTDDIRAITETLHVGDERTLLQTEPQLCSSREISKRNVCCSMGIFCSSKPQGISAS